MPSNCDARENLECPLDCKKIKSVNPKGNQSWIFTGRTDAEAETPVLWPPDVKSQLTGKDPDAGKDWRQEKGTTEDEIVGWHHQLNGHELGQTLGDSEAQGGFACCSPWVGHGLSDWTVTMTTKRRRAERKESPGSTHTHVLGPAVSCSSCCLPSTFFWLQKANKLPTCFSWLEVVFLHVQSTFSLVND